MSLRGKRVLITAGPTWVPIDSVRVISNIATGQTGMLLAKAVRQKGASATLFLGPCECPPVNGAIAIRHFKFFEELRSKLIKELNRKKYDIIIHNAAVSDFKAGSVKDKIPSGKGYSLKLKPLPKIASDIRRLAPKAKLVVFKLESGAADKVLIERARRAGAKLRADLIVANRLKPYRAFIIDKQGNQIPAKSKQELTKKLVWILSQEVVNGK